MLDLDLLRSFVSVVDAGSFTRAGERVHRTQSTVSQQIRRLEESLGRPLLIRNGKQATPTDEGERLLSYARRILALAEEAREVVARPESDGVVRLGIPEDFAANRLTRLLSKFARSRPGLRLDVRCDLSVHLQNEIDAGELDIALMKRDAGEKGALATWPETLNWVTSRDNPVDLQRDPVPLAVFAQGCLYRKRAIHALESAGRTWYIAYTSPHFAGIQAAVSAGLGVSILPATALRSDHRVLRTKDGFPAVSNTELALVLAADASPATQRLGALLAEFCAGAEVVPVRAERTGVQTSSGRSARARKRAS
ncbi:MAG TPA: LysR substrate-binding domain-containing protein [Xanthobacteraceae bacterium]|nr:LysR substrate-binding domain-containing protein [Xanthobacteraceae bacterium]